MSRKGEHGEGDTHLTGHRLYGQDFTSSHSLEKEKVLRSNKKAHQNWATSTNHDKRVRFVDRFVLRPYTFSKNLKPNGRAVQTLRLLLWPIVRASVCLSSGVRSWESLICSKITQKVLVITLTGLAPAAATTDDLQQQSVLQLPFKDLPFSPDSSVNSSKCLLRSQWNSTITIHYWHAK